MANLTVSISQKCEILSYDGVLANERYIKNGIFDHSYVIKFSLRAMGQCKQTSTFMKMISYLSGILVWKACVVFNHHVSL